MSTLVVNGSLDVRQTTLSDINDFSFVNLGLLDINAAQFDGVQASPASTIESDSSGSLLRIHLNAVHNFSIAGFSFVDWSPQDDIQLIGTADADTITGSGQSDIFFGKGGGDSMIGGGGNDLFDYADALVADVVDGGDGTDILRFSGSSNLTLSSLTSIESLFFQADASVTLTGAQMNSIKQVSGDALTPGAVNTLTVVGSNVNLATITFSNWADGVDHVVINGASADANTLTGSRVAETFNGKGGSDRVTALDGNDTILGLGGTDSLDGGPGDDLIDGGDGTDTVSYATSSPEGFEGIIVNLSIAVSQNTGIGGTDTLVSIESLIGSRANDVLTGNATGNSISGESGNDTLNGGDGVDSLAGGLGGDTYILSDVHQVGIIIRERGTIGTKFFAYDSVSESEDGGGDTVRVLPTTNGTAYALPTNVEDGIVDGSGSFRLTGNELANFLIGNDSDNTLNGAANADVLAGAGGNDTYFVDTIGDFIVEDENQGTDSVTAGGSYRLDGRASVEFMQTANAADTTALILAGNDFSQSITGNAGANVLNGFGGADTMAGLGGDDSYRVDNALDQVVEAAGGGTDTIVSFITLTLADQVENLILSGAATISGVGNAAANRITGNSAANVLNGLAGADTLAGGGGNDLYVVDNSFDRTIEAQNAGTDKVISSVSLALADNIEFLALGGTAAINGVGNALANQMTGNQAANLLNGLGGADTMTGLGGNDIYIVDNALDQIHEAANGGIDTVNATVNRTLGANEENLQLFGSATNGTGNELANRLTGNAGVNLLSGLAGDDVMTGGLGADRLNGGLGHDIFDFNSIEESGVTATARDTITGFVQTGASRDHIDLFSIDAKSSTAGNDAFTFIGTEGFTAEGQIRFGFSGNQTIVQINTTGTSVAEATIVLTGNIALTGADFFL